MYFKDILDVPKITLLPALQLFGLADYVHQIANQIETLAANAQDIETSAAGHQLRMAQAMLGAARATELAVNQGAPRPVATSIAAEELKINRAQLEAFTPKPAKIKHLRARKLEHDIARLFALGKSDPEIATATGKHVKHIARVRRKIGLRSCQAPEKPSPSC